MNHYRAEYFIYSKDVERVSRTLYTLHYSTVQCTIILLFSYTEYNTYSNNDANVRREYCTVYYEDCICLMPSTMH